MLYRPGMTSLIENWPFCPMSPGRPPRPPGNAAVAPRGTGITRNPENPFDGGRTGRLERDRSANLNARSRRQRDGHLLAGDDERLHGRPRWGVRTAVGTGDDDVFAGCDVGDRERAVGSRHGAQSTAAEHRADAPAPGRRRDPPGRPARPELPPPTRRTPPSSDMRRRLPASDDDSLDGRERNDSEFGSRCR